MNPFQFQETIVKEIHDDTKVESDPIKIDTKDFSHFSDHEPNIILIRRRECYLHHTTSKLAHLALFRNI